MLKNKSSALPLHHGVAPSGSGSSAMSQALDKTMSMVGLSTTKTGSGDKERAYVVKQNSLLKALLFCVLLAAVVLTVAFSTVLELRVTKRDWIKSEAVHHKRGHLDHEDFLHSSLELQEALEFSIEETRNLEEFRAYFEREEGSHESQVKQILQEEGASVQATRRVRHSNREFAAEIQMRLARMINRFQDKTVNATDKVRLLARKMGKEIELDQRMELNFKERLAEWGVDEDYAEAAVDEYEEEYAAEEHVNEDPASVVKRRRDGEKQSEVEIVEHVERFFAKLGELDLPEIPEVVVKELDIALGNFLDTLPDEAREADMGAFQQQMDLLLQPHPSVERFDPAKHDSLIDHYGAIVEKSKLARHKQELMDLYTGWKTPGSKLTERNLLAAIEQLAEREDMVKMFDLMDGRDMDPNTKFEVVEVEEEVFDTVVEGEAPKLVKRMVKKVVRKLDAAGVEREEEVDVEEDVTTKA